MTELILHHYPESPFSEKVRAILGAKGLAWRSLQVPMIMPRPATAALTGGYRRIPVLQAGAELVIVDIDDQAAQQLTNLAGHFNLQLLHLPWGEMVGNVVVGQIGNPGGIKPFTDPQTHWSRARFRCSGA